MLQLKATKLKTFNFNLNENPFLIKIYEDDKQPLPIRRKSAYLVKGQDIPSDYSLYLTFDAKKAQEISTGKNRVILLDQNYEYLADRDVLRINPAKSSLRVLFRANSKSNSFLVTERCDNFCLMCSQPPRDIEDGWIAEEILEAIPLIEKSTQEIGFTGGEPTLLGERFLAILEKCKNYLPDTAIHILSNGRKFSDKAFTASYSKINHPDMMVGIPVYSDVAHIHDYVVQAENAFNETIRGILNLKNHGQRVEIRIVVHKQTYDRLPQLTEFITRNLAFVDHVALMGLELMGFTKANMEKLWIDPFCYKQELLEATHCLALSGVNVSIYNHQLCTIDRDIWPYARKSISDWKNEYLDACEACTERDNCGGFFSSQLVKPSQHIEPII